MKKIASVAALSLLAGCVTIMSYQEPQVGPRAKVRFSTDSVDLTVLRQYSDAGCQENESEMMRLRNGVLAGSTPKRLGIPMWSHHDNAAKEVYIAAGKPFYAMLDSARVKSITRNTAEQTMEMKSEKCSVPFSYVFEEGQEYEVAFSQTPGHCSVQILRFDRSGSDVRPVRQSPLKLDTAACAKTAEKKRMF